MGCRWTSFRRREAGSKRINRIRLVLTMSLFVFLFYKCVAAVEIFLNKGIFKLGDSLALLPCDIFLGASHSGDSRIYLPTDPTFLGALLLADV